MKMLFDRAKTVVPYTYTTSKMSSFKMQNIIIIGTGLAGYLTAKEFRKYDSKTPMTLITRSDGHFYSKPLLSTALTQHKAPDQLIISTVDLMRAQLNAAIFTHCNVFKIDPDNKKVFYLDENNKEHALEYDKLVLANGARKVDVALNGDAVKDVLFVNQLEDYRQFRDKLVNVKDIAILGAGLIACEFANDLANSGYTVKLIAPDPYPLSARVPEIIGRTLQKVFNQKDIQFYGSVFPKAVNHKNTGFQVVLSDKTTVDAAIVLSAVGIKPDLSLAKTAKLKTNVGVIVDASMQTCDPHIFAVGECAEVDAQLTMHIAPILVCSQILGKVLAGDKQSVHFTVMPIVIKTPACPIVLVMPPLNCAGEWRIISSQDENIHTEFYDNENKLKGFALSGTAVKEKNHLCGLLISEVNHD